ncbi:MAG: hypothetical protein J6C75_02415 [Oscillospiraceae bacterium]|nr:hypothetical protein [Oscillospiraceae bacterium]MBP1577315.1 hypothetical protein [Oscillospiraceae bacterium]
MNNLNGISPDKLDALLKTAGKRLGKDPQTLKNQLQSGNLNGLGVSEQQQQQIGQLLKDPQALSQFFEQPQIKQMINQLMKGR